MRVLLPLIPGLIVLASCSEPPAKPARPDFLAADIDSSANPTTDFFAYANGGWIKKTPIPAAESGWGVGNLVKEDIYDRLRKVNEAAAAKKAAEGTIEQKIGDFWFSAMDSVAINRQGLAPLRETLGRIDDITGIADLTGISAYLNMIGVDVLFADYVAQDDKNSDVMAYQLYQGGLGMPNRDYYFNTDARTAGIRDAYRHYLLVTLQRLAGSQADTAAFSARVNAIFDLETRLAKSSRKLADLRDPYKNYHKMSVAAFSRLSANFNWPAYLHQIGIDKLDSVIVGQPEFYAALNRELKSTPLPTWKDYLKMRLVASSAPFLDDSTFTAYFNYRKSLSGASEPRPRWKRALDAEEGAMGEALGQLFVKEYFNEKAKKRYSDMVEAIRVAYKERIKKLDWMGDSTKAKAYDKLAHITKKVGYPDKWKDFSALKIDRGPFVLNMQRAAQWWHRYNVNKLGKPVDRAEWGMSPQTYNAYYNPANNEIVLPAGIFTVPGMRDEELDDAFVYGYAAASTIGHEITHGFDDQGRQYDAAGNLHNWWQPQDEKQFKARAQSIIRQFNGFNPVDTLHVNGDATQGENIADLGGLLLGLDAFRKTDFFKKGEKRGGLTPLQRYFLGYAYGWLYQERKERLAAQVMTDVHAPAKERVNGPLMNIPEFYEAFNVKPGDAMYRPDSLRVKIW